MIRDLKFYSVSGKTLSRTATGHEIALTADKAIVFLTLNYLQLTGAPIKAISVLCRVLDEFVN